MEVRFHYDPDTELPHIYNHGVTEDEVLEIFRSAPMQLRGQHGALFALGQTFAGRYLKVVYRQNSRDELFVITAFPLTGKALAAYRRRRRRKP